MLTDTVLKILTENRGQFVSGQALARQAGVTRAAVWKSIQALQSRGFAVTAAPRCGYRLEPEDDTLSALGIQQYLRGEALCLNLQTVDCTASTNSDLKLLAQQGASAGTVLVAGQHTGGRGRRGRSFFSPPGTGVYISLLLRPQLQMQQAVLFTTAASVAVCRAVEKLTGQTPQIKWVNDVFINGKKVCGILTEAAADLETGMVEYAVLGLGLNVTEPVGGFPPEVARVAGSIFKEPQGNAKNRLTAEVLNQLANLLQNPAGPDIYSDYKSRQLLLGHKVTFEQNGVQQTATAVDVARDYGLVVQLPNGQQRVLSSGEVSCRLA